MSSIFSRDKLVIPIVLPQSLWLVFTSNLNSQTTWLKVKLKSVNFLVPIDFFCFCCASGGVVQYQGHEWPLILNCGYDTSP